MWAAVVEKMSRMRMFSCLIVIFLMNSCYNPSFLTVKSQQFGPDLELFSDDPNVLRNSVSLQTHLLLLLDFFHAFFFLFQTQILESRGFQSEIHHPITEDGYVLTLVRIINPYIRNGRTRTWNNNNMNNATTKPILMQHGLVCNSDFWLLSRDTRLLPTGEYVNENGTVTDCSGDLSNTVGTSLAMVLSACGYDVWLGNYRGNRYSYEHVLLNSRSDQRYWEFSIDELSRYDLPAEIFYILSRTGNCE